ncbi:MAG: glycerol acyltransferase, partial [Bacteroidaceae bacterium]|nr:glycerol acyltransferase [Bacteroidaceae bacterium]
MQVSEQSVTSIDIGSIIRARAKGKARYIPSFLIKFLERFIHQDFINAYLKRGLVGVPFCKGVLE